MSNEKNLSILGHLAEFRSRLFRSVIAVILTTIVAFVFSNQIFHVLTLPIKGNTLIYIDMTEMFGVYMKVGLTAGIFLAMPYLIFQILLFVTPALTLKEKKYVFVAVPWVALMFLGGVAFSYFVLLPPAIRFLFSFGSNIATPQIRIGSYIDVVTRLMFITGCIFELPVATTFLAKLGVVTSEWLAGKRKWAIILAFVLGAIITPTVDPLNQTLIAAPLIVLYEMSIWLAKLVQSKTGQKSFSYSSLNIK
ncbi:MAG TPA: twin-arginine translocase subunit TatC [Dehalococcoidales bacterium]